MQYQSVSDIRHNFLDYFIGKDHQLIPQSGILPKNDPTLLFINSGMAPMKSYFRGIETPPCRRLTNIQDCIRTVDINDVGDSYHGSSFRMMGSWSFGDYFKEDAIDFAFQLITEGFGFPTEKLYATVYGGDPSLPEIPADEESAHIWERYLHPGRILRRPASDNFWGPAGDSGPCGPCTEIFFDRGESYGIQSDNDSDPLISGRHIEIWNAGVFMQYEMAADRSIELLPLRCVDTGAGLERFAMLLQNAPSIHEIDQYQQVYGAIYGHMKDVRRSRIVLDHLKTSLMMMCEGVSPGNQRHHYVLRQLLRRTFTAFYLAGVKIEEIFSLVREIAEVIDCKDRMREVTEFVNHCLIVESTGFSRMLQRSDKYLMRIDGSREIDASTAFELKTTHGVPTELLVEFCSEREIVFPYQELEKLLREHSDISRA